MTENHLIPVEKADVAILFSEQLDGVLAEIETQAVAHKADLTTSKGRDAIAAMAYKVARSKTFIDEMGKEANAERKKQTDLINGFRKKARDFLDELRDKVRLPLDKWEAEQAELKAAEEAAEKAKAQRRVDELLKVGVTMDYFDVASLSDDEFENTYQTAEAEWAAEQARVQEEALDKAEKEAAEKAEREAEAKHLADEKERLEKWDAEQKEKEEKLRAEQREIQQRQQETEKALQEQRRKLEAEKKAVEDAKKAAQEAKARAEFEKKAQEEAIAHAAKQAEEEVLWAAEQERLEAEEKERKKALLPIRDRLYDYADDILKETPPAFEDEPGNAIVRWAVSEIKELSDQIKVRADAL